MKYTSFESRNIKDELKLTNLYQSQLKCESVMHRTPMQLPANITPTKTIIILKQSIESVLAVAENKPRRGHVVVIHITSL